MFKINQLPVDTRQQQSLVLPDGNVIGFEMEYIPLQYGWFITNLSYKDFLLQGTRITVSPNILHQFRNQLPFGLSCIASVNLKREPTQQGDFASGAFSLFILDSSEVEQYHRFLNGK